MKNLCILVMVILGGRMLSGCSDDGVYTPVEYDAGTDAPASACAEKAGCPDAGE